MTESDDDEPQLSQLALSALQEFYKEREKRENQLKKISDESNGEAAADVTFDEDWVRISWYTCNRDISPIYILIKNLNCSLNCCSN